MTEPRKRAGYTLSYSTTPDGGTAATTTVCTRQSIGAGKLEAVKSLPVSCTSHGTVSDLNSSFYPLSSDMYVYECRLTYARIWAV